MSRPRAIDRRRNALVREELHHVEEVARIAQAPASQVVVVVEEA